ncbi:MAG: hypothetical protein K8R59_00825 [Thermoanaerobaculales bacterium]|nr:hypothetical protein [Thermoanaerobaculales bacterium]
MISELFFRRWRDGVHLPLVVLVVLLYLLFRTPSPEYFLADTDGGVQLAAAQQILTTGEQPWVDFMVPYGPLTYYASAIAQWLSGGRLIGEILLILVGYGLSYVILFLLARRISSSDIAAWLILLFCLLLMPRYYKYYVVLCPVVVLFALWRWIDRPRPGRLVFVGLAAGISFLFRIDLGLFALVAMVTAILLRTDKPFVYRAKAFGGAVFLSGITVSPWLIYVALKGDVREFLSDLWLSVTYSPQGIALPHPLLSWNDPMLSCLYWIVFMVPTIATGVLVLQWRKIAIARRALIATTIVLAFACLVMASHRSDLAHLLQGAPIAVASLAIVVGIGPRPKRFLDLGGFLVLSLGAAIFLAYLGRLPPTDILRFGTLDVNQVGRSLRCASMDRPTFLNTVERDSPGLWPLPVIRYVRESTEFSDRVCIWPFRSQLLYFAERPFGGLTTVLLPGRSDLPRHQRRIIEEFEDRPPAFVLWDEDYILDRDEKRRPTMTHAAVHSWVRSRCSNTGGLNRFTVYRCDEYEARSIDAVDGDG